MSDCPKCAELQLRFSDVTAERDALALRLEAWQYVTIQAATYNPPPEFLAKFRAGSPLPEAPK